MSALERVALFVVVAALVALGAAAVFSGAGAVTNPAIVCGSAYIDGGVNPATDAGHLDGGYSVVQVPVASVASLRVENNGTTPVYLGGSTVQPSTGGVAICTTAATCADSKIQLDSASGEMYCVATSAITLRTLAAGF